jgi:hypothetical protein
VWSCHLPSIEQATLEPTKSRDHLNGSLDWHGFVASCICRAENAASRCTIEDIPIRDTNRSVCAVRESPKIGHAVNFSRLAALGGRFRDSTNANERDSILPFDSTNALADAESFF